MIDGGLCLGNIQVSLDFIKRTCLLLCSVFQIITFYKCIPSRAFSILYKDAPDEKHFKLKLAFVSVILIK